MSEKSLTKNYLYNSIYQVISIIVPVILIPILSRTLGANGLGVFSFTQSIATYFSLFALLGVRFYGSKAISINRSDKDKLSKTFYEIFILKVFTSLIAMVLFYGISLFFDNKEILWIQGILLIANLLDITWYYTGTENFKSIVIRNGIVKLITLVLVIFVVKKPEDVWLYALILVISEFIGQFIMWFDILFNKQVNKISLYKNDLKYSIHLKGMFILFIPQVISTLFTTLNITMIGLLSNNFETGIYDLTTRIINALIMIMISLNTVMIPRIAKLNADNDKETIKKVFQKAISMFTYLSFPMAIGLSILSSIFIPWFLGEEFIVAIPLVYFLVFKIIFVPYSNSTGYQYLVPTNRNREFLISVSVAAIVNLTLNFVLIPQYGAIGSAIGMIVAEFMVLFVQIVITRKEIPFFRYIIFEWKIIISSVFMGIIILMFKDFLYPILDNQLQVYMSSTWSTLISLSVFVVLGMLSYAVILFLMRDKTQKMIFGKAFEILKIKKN